MFQALLNFIERRILILPSVRLILHTKKRNSDKFNIYIKNMIHKIDKKAIKRIVDLRQVQGLSFPIIGERFGISTARAVKIFKRHQQKQQDSNTINLY